MLYVGRSEDLSSRYKEASTRERLGPAGARTAQVTALDLPGFLFSLSYLVGVGYLQNFLAFLLVDLRNPG